MATFCLADLPLALSIALPSSSDPPRFIASAACHCADLRGFIQQREMLVAAGAPRPRALPFIAWWWSLALFTLVDVAAGEGMTMAARQLSYPLHHGWQHHSSYHGQHDHCVKLHAVDIVGQDGNTYTYAKTAELGVSSPINQSSASVCVDVLSAGGICPCWHRRAHRTFRVSDRVTAM